MLKDLAELGMKDRGEDEVLDLMVDGGFDHVDAGCRKSAKR